MLICSTTMQLFKTKAPKNFTMNRGEYYIDLHTCFIFDQQFILLINCN